MQNTLRLVVILSMAATSTAVFADGDATAVDKGNQKPNQTEPMGEDAWEDIGSGRGELVGTKPNQTEPMGEDAWEDIGSGRGEGGTMTERYPESPVPGTSRAP